MIQTYESGQQVTTTYNDAPVTPEKQYKVGQVVDIEDCDTRELIAQFRVTETDDTTISGIII